MGQAIHDDVTDPDNVPEVFVAGVHVTIKHGLAHFVGWQENDLSDGRVDKRIVVRTVLPEHVARQMVSHLVTKLPPQH